MNAQELRQKLRLEGSTLTLSRDSLGGKFGELLALHYGTAPLCITQAALAPDAAADGAIILTGKATFANVADLPLTARFTLDEAGEVQAELRYRLRDDNPGPAAWRFSTSFRALPATLNHFTRERELLLDSLLLYDTALVLVTRAAQDATFGVALAAGVINFVSRLRPQGMLGVFEHLASASPVLTLHGIIRLPQPGDANIPLKQFEHPWERLASKTLPLPAGIYLQAALDLGFQSGKIALGNGQFRIYSPISEDWMQHNPSFRPLHGYTATLSIASAGIEVNLGADVAWGVAQALLYATLDGVTLGKLAHLIDFTGDSGLLEQLPAELRQPVEALEKLELTHLALDLIAVGGLPTIRALFVTVGFPNLRWKLWKDDLVVDALSCRFSILDPLRSASAPSMFRNRLSVLVGGVLEIEGAKLAVSASNDDGFEVRATTLEPISLPLDKLVKTHGPGVPVPSALSVTYLDVRIAPGQRYSMDMLLAGASAPWTLELGKDRLTIQNVALQIERPATGQVTGTFAGTIDFADATLQVQYNFPGNFVLRGMLPPLKLSQVLASLCNHTVKLPGGFELDLPSSAVLIQEQQGSLVFQLAADVKGCGLLAFEARKASDGGWGFACGLDLSAGQPSTVPGLAALAALEKQLHLSKFLLVVSSIDQPGFQLPDAAQFNTPQLATKKVVLPGRSGGVTAGLNLFAEWSLDSADKKQNLLKQLLGLPGVLDVTIQIPESPSAGTRLFIGRSGTLQGHPFQYKLGMQLDHGMPSLFLTGSVTVDIHKQPQTFELSTAFVPGGAFLSATLKGTVDCGPFKLSNLALEVGVDWAGIPSLGIAASVDVKDITSSVAVFFDATDPARSLVAGSISDLTARDVLRALAGNVQTPLDALLATIAVRGTHAFTLPGELSDALDGLVVDKIAGAFAAAKVTIPASSQQLSVVSKTRGASWHLTDLTKMRHYQLAKQGDKIHAEILPQFYFAPQPTAIGTIQFPQGYYLNAAIEFAGFHAAATIEIAANKGFAIDAQMDKVVILDEKLFAIAALQGGGGPRISVSTFAQPDHAEAQFRLPHFCINGSMTLLGVKQGLYASVTKDGIDFALLGELLPGVHFDLEARFGRAGIGANGKVRVGIGTIDLGKLGKAKVNTELAVELDLDLDNAAHDVSLGGGASFAPGATLLLHEHARLVFQTDGNLVLYKTSGEPLWASNTAGRGATEATFQRDGNLVIYGASGPLWASNTNAPNVNRLSLQSDGNLVIYDSAGGARWATGTNGAWAAAGCHLELESSFEFAGHPLRIARFRVDAKPDTFTQLPAILGKKVEEAIGELFKDMTHWANAIKGGVIEGVHDTAKVFKDVYGKSEHEAQALASGLGKDLGKATHAVEHVATDVGKATANTAKKVIKKLKFW